MKAKTIAKRLRARADQLHERARTFQNGDQSMAERARLLADVLQEVSDQIAPRSKKKRKQEQQEKQTKQKKQKPEQKSEQNSSSTPQEQ